MVSPETLELIRRAESVYHDRLKAELEAGHLHEYVVIEPESGDYFLGHTPSDATALHRAAHPNRRGHLMRVGHRTAYHMGGMT
jgi:hypothetical protein